MDADEILPLTREALQDLLATRRASETESDELGKRQLPRWPFPGTVELWVPGAGGREEHVIGTLHDLSEGGVGLRADREIEPGQVLSVAVHQPEASFHGKATVRHCTPRRNGFHVGMEFRFD